MPEFKKIKKQNKVLHFSSYDANRGEGSSGCLVFLYLVGFIILVLVNSVIAMELLGGHEGLSAIMGFIITLLLIGGVAFIKETPALSIGCFIALVVVCIVLYFIPGGSDSDYQEKKRDSLDPISWREEEEKDEARLGYDKAPYKCKRCGMRSFDPLNDGVRGVDGYCIDCFRYEVLKQK